MRTFLFILALVVLIGAGLFFKNKGVFSGKEKAKTGKENERFDTTGGKSLTQPMAMEWENILKGQWTLKSREASENGTWLVEANIVFKEQKKFNLYVTEKYFNGIRDFNSTDGADIIQGGNESGSWQLIDNSILKFTQVECKIETSHKDTYTKGFEIGCEYFESHLFGNVSGKTYKTKIEKFEQNQIVISGKDYSKDGIIYYVFTKNE